MPYTLYREANAGQQGNGDHLEEIPDVSGKEKILEIHITREIHKFLFPFWFLCLGAPPSRFRPFFSFA